MQLTFLVEEKSDTYKFEVDKRSDGFKQFVSIILNLSIENETGVLNNKVILLDEPETHLHPSGQKYLRNELLKISENNLVIYATHSITVKKFYITH
jgi:predicted ATP-dependent endonuclease of OLD family